MTQRKKRTIIDELLPEEQQRESGDTDISDLVITLSKVYRVNPNGKRSFSFQTSEPVDEMMIQERCPNGGSFAVFEYNSSGEVVNSASYDIEPKTTPATTNPVGSSGDIRVEMLMSELQWSRQMVMQLMGNRNSESTPVSEIVSAIKDMHSIAGGNGKDPVDLIIKGMELANKANRGEAPDWKTELISGAKEAIGPVLSALNRQQPQPQQTGEVTMIPAGAPTPDAIVRDAIKWLKGKILFGLTPDLAVDWILQNGNDPQYQPILATAVNGTVDNFIAVDTELANEPYRTWFTTAIQLIKDAYAEQSANNSDMGGGAGNAPNNAANEKLGASKPKLKKVS